MHNWIAVGVRSPGVAFGHGLVMVHGDNASSSPRIRYSRPRILVFRTRARKSEYCVSRIYWCSERPGAAKKAAKRGSSILSRLISESTEGG